ncbi:MAG: N-acetylglucosamine-6-phosphate deacetylase [Clostridia bacterium]|nr:N-acetylglucosamine-6-phosphate deacetylase [Clostridia bacterium]
MLKVIKITNGVLLTPHGTITDQDVYLKEGKIEAITADDLPYDELVDAGGKYVSPGFIDVHVHGGGGYDFMDGGTEPIIKAAAMHLSHGTTSIMPTTLACSYSALTEFLNHLRTVMDEGLSEANILGAHLEGPYFSGAQSGAQNPEYIKVPDPSEYLELLDDHGDIIRHWSFAPELEGAVAFCETLSRRGVRPSIGHSDAVFSEVEKVYEKGCRKVTHLYSGMSTITRQQGYRRLGVIESAYYYDDMFAEVIADGKHLPPELLRVIVKGIGIDRICLVTDAMRGAGMPEGPSFLGRKGEEMPCIIEDGVAKLLDRSAFAGSVATADRLIRTMVQEVGLSVYDAVKMMTLNPASFFGIRKGALEEGFDADVIIFDENITVTDVFVNGIRRK